MTKVPTTTARCVGLSCHRILKDIPVRLSGLRALCALQRKQVGIYLAEHQIVQERLSRLCSELVTMQLYMVHVADIEAAGKLRPTQAALAKYNNIRTARRIAA